MIFIPKQNIESQQFNMDRKRDVQQPLQIACAQIERQSVPLRLPTGLAGEIPATLHQIGPLHEVSFSELPQGSKYRRPSRPGIQMFRYCIVFLLLNRHIYWYKTK